MYIEIQDDGQINVFGRTSQDALSNRNHLRATIGLRQLANMGTIKISNKKEYPYCVKLYLSYEIHDRP